MNALDQTLGAVVRAALRDALTELTAEVAHLESLDLLHGAEAIARFANTKPRTVYHWAQTGADFPIGSSLAARKSALQAWACERERSANSGSAD